VPVSLAELGISEEFANRCRAVAATPEGALEEYAAKVMSEEDGEMTTAGYLAFCKKRGLREGNCACSKSTTEAEE
jgi:hypothetical protein